MGGNPLAFGNITRKKTPYQANIEICCDALQHFFRLASGSGWLIGHRISY